MTLPEMSQFRLEITSRHIAHLIFDCPGRTMNVFSESAIADLAAFAAWLLDADIAGVVIRSGKTNAFCAGADLTELARAYDMIMAAPWRVRFDIAYAQFQPLGRALRALEVAGKPIAAALGGLALGGGCEFALAAHYRVLVDAPKIGMGLPESLVGLLPGAGGTQRLPRLVGVAASMPILLDGGRLGGEAALAAGLVHALVKPGDEVSAAESWVVGQFSAIQPWDQEDWIDPTPAETALAVAPARASMLAASLGHFPALHAVLDCVEFGLPQPFDGAYRTEMSVFAHLIQRPEARDMIQIQFLAKTEYERLARKDELPDWIDDASSIARAAFAQVAGEPALVSAGFAGAGASPVRMRSTRGYWIDGDSAEALAAHQAVEKVGRAVAEYARARPKEQRRLIDYAAGKAIGFPPYLGGPISFVERIDAA